MPIDFDEMQTRISCRGDVLVVPFGPIDGVAWLLLQEREAGEPGREASGLDPMCLAEQPGVLLAADDPRSLEAIIDGLCYLRDRLAEGGNQ